MGSPEHQALISAAVTDAVGSFCKGRQPRTPPVVATRAGQGSKQATALRRNICRPHSEAALIDPAHLFADI